ncbi:hypothetical protein [Bernardetia sp. MNP-M8]
MDYNTLNGKVDRSVERKIFYKFQWDKMIETGDSKNYFLEDN